MIFSEKSENISDRSQPKYRLTKVSVILRLSINLDDKVSLEIES